MNINIYIGQYKVDLFDQEKIEVTQKLVDVEKLSNVFSDLTNTFTVPATAHNNKIFRHYYDNDVDDTFNANIRIDGYMEIDTLPFRFGQWQLEGGYESNQRANNYKITFYGKIMQLSDLFGKDTLDILDYDSEGVKRWDSLSKFNYARTNTNIYNSIINGTFSNGDIITPLIAYTNRDWNWGGGDAYDISNSLYPITPIELRQSLRVIRIIEAIETKYAITFSRDFFGQPWFNKLHLWLNAKGDKPSGNVELNWDNLSTYVRPGYPNPNPWWLFTLDSTNNILNFSQSGVGYDPTRFFQFRADFNTLLNPNSFEVLGGVRFTFTLMDVDTGTIFYQGTQESYDNGQATFIWYIPQSAVPTSVNLKAYLSAPVSYIFSQFAFRLQWLDPADITLAIYQTFLRDNGDDLNKVRVDVGMPPMLVLDFIQGIMKMFKLIIRPITTTDFYINTLDGYYDDGNILNITDYVDVKNTGRERPVIYNKIQFTFQKTDNVLGKAYRKANDPIFDKIGYGDIKIDYPLIQDKNELSIDLPFENMLFERMSDLTVGPSASNVITNIAIGQSIKLGDDGATIERNDSKPILFFNNGTYSIADHPIKFRASSASPVQTFTVVNNIGNTDSPILGSVSNTLNWGAEIDPWHNVVVYQSLYENYWKNWLETVYSIKQGKFKFDAWLPPRYIQEISMNDRLIIGDKRYKISDYKIDLTTGKTLLNLFYDVY